MGRHSREQRRYRRAEEDQGIQALDGYELCDQRDHRSRRRCRRTRDEDVQLQHRRSQQVGLRDPGVLQGDPQAGGGQHRQRLRGFPGQPRPEGGHRRQGVPEERHPHPGEGRLCHRRSERVHQRHVRRARGAGGRDPRPGAGVPQLRPVHQLLRGQDRPLQDDRV